MCKAPFHSSSFLLPILPCDANSNLYQLYPLHMRAACFGNAQLSTYGTSIVWIGCNLGMRSLSYVRCISYLPTKPAKPTNSTYGVYHNCNWNTVVCVCRARFGLALHAFFTSYLISYLAVCLRTAYGDLPSIYLHILHTFLQYANKSSRSLFEISFYSSWGISQIHSWFIHISIPIHPLSGTVKWRKSTLFTHHADRTDRGSSCAFRTGDGFERIIGVLRSADCSGYGGSCYAM